MRKDPNGIYHIGDDGVVRSFDANAKVIDFVPLSPEDLADAIELVPDDVPGKHEWRKHLKEVWTGVDGRKVEEHAMLFPPLSVLPLKFTRPDLMEPGPQSPNDNLDDKIFEKRQLGFCQSQWCTSSVGCMTLGCTGCFFPDNMTRGFCVL